MNVQDSSAHKRELAAIAKEDMRAFIKRHGAHVSVQALADVLQELGDAWQGDNGPAIDIEASLGHAPWRADDWRGAVP